MWGRNNKNILTRERILEIIRELLKNYPDKDIVVEHITEFIVGQLKKETISRREE